MLQLSNIIEGSLYSLIFATVIVFTNVTINHPCFNYNSSKFKIILLGITILIIYLTVFYTHCLKCGILSCIYIDPSSDSFKNVTFALFINLTLFVGGLHQQFYNGRFKSKILRFYKPQFQWNLFKKLFIVPVYSQILFRAILSRIIDPQLQHPDLVTFYTACMFSLCHITNISKFIYKHTLQYSIKSIGIQLIYNFIFGMYIGHIFVRSKTLLSAIAVHVTANFMGFPQYLEIFKYNIHDDRARKSTIFYLLGVLACIILCLFI